jgi:hypothetical protein
VSTPRALEDSVHPRLQSGASARPLNFTVRSHLGKLSAAKSWKCFRLAQPRRERNQTQFSCRRLRSTSRMCACGRESLRSRSGRAPKLLCLRRLSRLWRCASGASRVLEASGARFTRGLCRVRLRQLGRARTVPPGGVPSNNRWSGPWGLGGWGPRAPGRKRMNTGAAIAVFIVIMAAFIVHRRRK